MRLRCFSLEGYRSYRSPQSIELDERLTLLAGRNNVGKSALLAALLVPTRPPTASSIPPIADSLVYTWEVGVDELTRGLPEPRRSDPEFPLLDGPSTAEVLHEWLRSVEGERRTIRFAYRSSATTPTSIELPELKATASGRLRSLGWDAGPFADSSTCVDFFERLADEGLQRLRLIGPRRIEPSARQWRPEELLAADARNLNEVLAYLSSKRPSTFERLEATIRRAFPSILRVGLQDDGQSQGMVRPVLFFEGADDDDAVALSDCGTGVEQLVALTAGILSAPHPLVFLIDEPQAYLHPRAERVLLDLLDSHPEHQYVIATHSSVLLAAVEISQVRLVRLQDGESQVSARTDADSVLDELGVTAADLWLSDSVLWVEGPTEEAALGLIARHAFTRSERAGLVIRRMPAEAARFATSNHRNATAAFQFCAQTSAAVARLPVRMRFLFDRDEKSASRQDELRYVSSGLAVFLEVREFENLLIDAELLQAGLAEVLADVDGLDAPSVDDVAEAVGRLLEATKYRKLFPGGTPEGEAVRDVKGSELLDRLWHDVTRASYDKVRDSPMLVAHALRVRPALLQPLVDVLRDVIEPIQPR